MKKTIFLTLALLVVGAFTASAQIVRPTTTAPSNTTLNNGATPISSFYGKTMKITSHTKSGAPVTHVATDYCIFKSDGTYEQKWNSIVRTGTWTYNAAEKTIVIVCGLTTTYALNVPDNTKFTLTGAKEVVDLGL